MANDIEINQLPALGAPEGTDVIPVSRGDLFTKKLTIQQLIDFVAVGGKVISSIEITNDNDIIIHYSDSTTLNAGNIAKLHTRNTDTKLDEGNPNEVTALEIRTHIDDLNNPHQTTAEQVFPPISDLPLDGWKFTNASPAINPDEFIIKDQFDFEISTLIPLSQKGANNGVAELDNTGRVPSTQLPSYVDDVLEYANIASFPVSGETGKLYVALDTNLVYRWTGTIYVEVSAGGGIGGNGTTNKIPKFTSANTIGDSDIEENATEVIVSKKLSVNKTGSPLGDVNIKSSAIGAVLFYLERFASTDYIFKITNVGNEPEFDTTNADYIFKTDTNTKFRIKAAMGGNQVSVNEYDGTSNATFGVKGHNSAIVTFGFKSAAGQTQDIVRGLDSSNVIKYTIDADWRVIQSAPNSAPIDANIGLGQFTAYLDEPANKLMFRVKYSNGTLKTGEIPLV